MAEGFPNTTPVSTFSSSKIGGLEEWYPIQHVENMKKALVEIQKLCSGVEVLAVDGTDYPIIPPAAT